MKCWNGVLLLVWIGSFCATQAQEGDVMARIKRNFNALKNEEVEQPYTKGLDLLRIKYIEAIDRELEKAFKIGDLDTATALENEKKAFGFDGDPPDPNPKSATLIRLRGIYTGSTAKLETQRTANLQSLITKFSVVLEEQEENLTKDSQIDDALAVRTYRTKLATLPDDEDKAPVAVSSEDELTFPFSIPLAAERRESTGPSRETSARNLLRRR